MMKTLTFDNKNMNASKKQKLIAILLAGVLSLSAAFALSIANAQTATGANSDVTFSTVKIKDGGTITVNGGHALTYVGGKLISAETSKSTYLSSAVDSVLSTWTLDYYANDPVLTSITNNNKKPTLMSIDTYYKVGEWLPKVKSAYWLSDTKTWHGINMQAYRTKTNEVPSGSAISGVAPDGAGVYAATTSSETRGWASNDNVSLGGFIWPAYTWALIPDLNSGKDKSVVMTGQSVITDWDKTCKYYWDGTWKYELSYVDVRTEGQEVYNNPYCIEDRAKGYYKTTFKKLSRSINGAWAANWSRGTLRNTFYSKIVWNNGIPFYAIPGERNIIINEGDTLFSVDVKTSELDDATGFERYGDRALTYYKAQASGYNWGTARNSGPVYKTYGGVNADNNAKVQAYDKQMSGTKLSAARYAVRASYDVDFSNIAFFRDSASGASPVTDKQLGSAPDYFLGATTTKKTVLKRTDVAISLDINKTKKVANKDVAENFMTDRDANRDQQTTVKDGVVQVPWKSSTLTVKNVSTTNATHISALASTSGGKRYGLVGSANAASVDIDLTTLMDVSNTGDEITISLYAENISKGQTSDSISQTPVTFKVKIIPGRQTSITYDFGTNGTGTLPNNSDPTKTLAGTTYAFGDGSNCYTKTGDPFSCWKVTYTLYDGTTKIEKYFSGEQFVVPDTVDGKVLVTATYASMDVSKSTSTTSTVCTVTWNLNKPKDATSTNSTFKLDGSTTATWKNTRATVTMPGSGIYRICSVPTVTDDKGSWTFMGWSTNPNATSGSKSLIGTTVAKHVQYYAIWQEASFTVTWNLNSSSYSGGNFKLNGQSSITQTYLKKNNYPNAQNLINPGTPTDNSGVWEFDCWKDSSGNKVNFDQAAGAVKKVESNATYYAKWKSARGDYWFAKAGAKDPESDVYKSKSVIDEDIIAIRNNDAKVIDEYKALMNDPNDTYHLYTNYCGTDAGADANRWVEFRIIHVGQHDNDGSALTFMAVHTLPTCKEMNSVLKYSNRAGWGGTTMRSEIFPSYVSSGLANIPAKQIKKTNYRGEDTNDTFWLISWSEMVGGTSTTDGNGNMQWDGSQYDWFAYKDYTIDNYYYKEKSDWFRSTGVTKTRNGDDPLDPFYYTERNNEYTHGVVYRDVGWNRSAFIVWDSGHNANSDSSWSTVPMGYIGYSTDRLGVVPCFAF